MTRKNNKSTGRRYDLEYKNYQGKPAQKKRRAKRNAARRKMISAGRASKGDGKDVSHRNNNPNDNSMSNLSLSSKSTNRREPRLRGRRKKK